MPPRLFDVPASDERLRVAHHVLGPEPRVMDARVRRRDPGRPGHALDELHSGLGLRVDEAQVEHDLAAGEDHRDLGRELRAPLVAEQSAELLERGLEVLDHDPEVELVGPPHGSSTTRMAPPLRSDATRNASSASSSGKRCVITVPRDLGVRGQHRCGLVEFSHAVVCAVAERRDHARLLGE